MSETPSSPSWPKRAIAAVLVVTLLVAAAVFFYKQSRKGKSQAQPQAQSLDKAAKPEARAEKPSPNEIVLEPEQEIALEMKLVKAELTRGDHPLTLGGKISLDLEKTARVRPLFNVVIYKVEKHAGELVKKNDVILTVESTDLGTAKNAYLTAIANLEVAATTYRREGLLRMRQATTDVDFENARSGFRQAAVALMAAREQLLLMGSRPQELEDLRAELASQILSFANLGKKETSGAPHEVASATPSALPAPGNAGGPDATSAARQWELEPGLVANLPLLDPNAKEIAPEALALRPPTDAERQRDAKIALAEITQRFIAPRLKNEEDGRRRARYTIRAPIDGEVISKDAARGELVDPSQVIATVADTSDVWIILDIYQQQIASVERDAKVDVTTPAYPGKTFSGKVAFLSNYIDPATHTRKARVEVENPKNLLLSEMVAKCVVHCVDREPKIEVPTNAILDDAGKTFAIVKTAPGHYERRPVTLGLRTDDVVHIEDGVRPGEEVVLEGNLYIHSTIPLGD